LRTVRIEERDDDDDDDGEAMEKSIFFPRSFIKIGKSANGTCKRGRAERMFEKPTATRREEKKKTTTTSTRFSLLTSVVVLFFLLRFLCVGTRFTQVSTNRE
jgi:hypothetical protein